MRAALIAVFSLGLAGCQRQEVAPLLPAASASASARPPASTLRAPARAVIEQAIGVLKDCYIGQNDIDIYSAIDFDICPLDAGEVAALGARDDALATAAGAVDLVGLPATFVSISHMYRRWIDLTARTKDGRGTAAFYQSFAKVWNEWNPDAAVEVDPPSLVRSHFGVTEDRAGHFAFYMKNVHVPGARNYETFRKLGHALTWRRSANGAFIDGTGELSPP